MTGQHKTMGVQCKVADITECTNVHLMSVKNKLRCVVGGATSLDGSSNVCRV